MIFRARLATHPHESVMVTPASRGSCLPWAGPGHMFTHRAGTCRCFSTGEEAEVTWVGCSRTVYVSTGSSWEESCCCWAVGDCGNVQPGQIKWGMSDLSPGKPSAPVNIKGKFLGELPRNRVRQWHFLSIQ